MKEALWLYLYPASPAHPVAVLLLSEPLPAFGLACFAVPGNFSLAQGA
jgi:hypothetical protein